MNDNQAEPEAMVCDACDGLGGGEVWACEVVGDEAHVFLREFALCAECLERSEAILSASARARDALEDEGVHPRMAERIVTERLAPLIEADRALALVTDLSAYK